MNAFSVASARVAAPPRSVAAAGVKTSGPSAAPLLPARFVESAPAAKHAASCGCGSCRKSVVAFASPEPERPNSPNLPKPSGWSPQGISGDVAPIKENPLDASRPFRRVIYAPKLPPRPTGRPACGPPGPPGACEVHAPLLEVLQRARESPPIPGTNAPGPPSTPTSRGVPP